MYKLTQKEFDEVSLLVSKSRNTDEELVRLELFIQTYLNKDYRKPKCNCKNNKIKNLCNQVLKQVEIITDGMKSCIGCDELFTPSHHATKYCDNCKK